MANNGDERRKSTLHASGDGWRKDTVRLGDAKTAKRSDKTEPKALTVNQRLDGLRDMFRNGDVGASVAHSERWHRAHAAVEAKVKAYVDADPETRRGEKAYDKYRKEIGGIDDKRAKTAEARAFQASGPRVDAKGHELHHFVFPKSKYRDLATDPATLYPVRRESKADAKRTSVFDETKTSSAHTDLHRATGKEGKTEAGAPALFHDMAILDDLKDETRRSVQRHLEHQSSASQSLKRAMGALKRDARRRPK